MKPLLAPLAAGAAVAALLYGILWAAERHLPEPEDPWLDGFIAGGMKAEFRSSAADPAKEAMSGDAREAFKGPEYAGAVLRNYIVQNTSVQVLRFPNAGLTSILPPGRSLDYRFKPGGNVIHVCRSGRTLAFVGVMGKWIPIVGQMKTPRKQVEEIFDAFEETAKRYP